ncbi:MAG: methyl-accepting chemotaxis protein [Candidatus Woesearchaeota archaeon]
MSLVDYFIGMSIVLVCILLGNAFFYYRFGHSLITKINALISYGIFVVAGFSSYVGLYQLDTLNILLLLMLGFFLVLLPIAYLGKHYIIRPVEKVEQELKLIAKGDLRNVSEINSHDEFGDISSKLNMIIGNFVEIICKIKATSSSGAKYAENLSAASEEINSSVQQVSATIQQNADRAQGLSKLTEGTKEKIDVLLKSVSEVNSLVKSSNDSAHEVNAAAEKGSKAAKKASDTMQVINQTITSAADNVEALAGKIEDVREVINVISSVSEQTNLLALNAAIEAARAGDAGRGFAVVAEEIRKLAEESQKATQQIEQMINEYIQETTIAVQTMKEGTTKFEDGNKIINDALASLEMITKGITNMTSKIENIHASIEVQEKASQNVNSSIEKVSGIVSDTTASSQEISAAIQEVNSSMENVANTATSLAQGAEDLKKNIERFVI